MDKAKQNKIAGDVSQRQSGQKNSNPPPLRKRKYRKYLPANVRRYVYNKAQSKCQFVSPITNKPCKSQHFLEVEHKTPVAHGGNNELQNLRLYCREHNTLAAKQAHLT